MCTISQLKDGPHTILALRASIAWEPIFNYNMYIGTTASMALLSKVNHHEDHSYYSYVQLQSSGYINMYIMHGMHHFKMSAGELLCLYLLQ